jgi:alkaline phosphatase
MFLFFSFHLGIVTTARITHATPSCLYAHTAHRDWEADSYQNDDQKRCDDIAKQLIYGEAGAKTNVRIH